jgi:hypothetical protein
LSLILALHDVVHSQACCLCLLLSFPLQLLLDRRRSLMGVVVSVDPMEPTEEPFAAPLVWWMWLLWLRPSAILVPSFVLVVVPILVLVRGRGYIDDLTGSLLRRVILPPLRLVPPTLLLLLLGCVSSVQPSATTFIGLAVFLHYLKQFLQGLRLDSVKHILAVSDPQTPDNGVNSAAFGHPRRTRCQLHHSVHILLQ